MLTTKNWGPKRFSVVLPCLVVVLLGGCTPPGPRALVEGDRLIQQGKYAPAIEKLQLATQLLPESSQPLAWNYLGLAHHRAGHPQPAIAAYQQALRRNPSFAVARFNLGCLYLEQNNPSAAASEFTSYTLLDRNAVNGWIKLGTAQLRSRQLDAAEKSFQTALQLDGTLTEALNGMGILQLHRKRPPEALRYFHTALQRQPAYGPALLNTAIVYHQHLNNLPLALQAYRNYLAVQPSSAEAATLRETIRQIELALTPAPRLAVTNQPAALPADPPSVARPTNWVAATNSTPPRQPSIAALSTNQVKVTPPDRTPQIEKAAALLNSNLLSNPKIVGTEISLPIAKTTNAPSISSPLTNTGVQPKIEVVKVIEEPVPKVAKDVTPNAAASPTNSVVPPESEIVPARKPEPSESERPRDLSSLNISPKNKRTITERLNPLSWFRSKDKPARPQPPADKEKDPPAAGASSEIKPELVRSNDVATKAPSVAVTPPVRLTPRYSYRPVRAPSPGDRGKAEPLFAEGLKAHRERRLAAAVQAYQQAVKLDPSFYEAHYNLGLAAYDLQNWTQSLSAYEGAMSINPTSLDARYNFALALQRGDYLRDAVNELEKILTNNSEEPKVHFMLAKLYAEDFYRTDLARMHYRRVLELEPQHPQATAIRYWLNRHP
jgi:tetratricopeptide (TPR) repeat protein